MNPSRTPRADDVDSIRAALCENSIGSQWLKSHTGMKTAEHAKLWRETLNPGCPIPETSTTKPEHKRPDSNVESPEQENLCISKNKSKS